MYHRPLIVAAMMGLAALSLSTLDASAHKGQRSGERPDFSELDTNGDGALTRAEVEAFTSGRLQSRFANADSNGDGELTREEMLAAGQGRAETRVDRMIERLDADNNGSLSQAELETARGERDGRRGDRFSRLDADGDGQITEEEWTAKRNRR